MEVRERSAPPWGLPLYRGDLLDVNVWVALCLAQHPHHACAEQYWQNTLARHNAEQAQNPLATPARIHFCRHTALGLVRVLLQATAHLIHHLSLQEAWAAYQRFRLLPEVAFAGESSDGLAFDAAISSAMVAAQDLPVRLWTDLQLASLAQMHGLRFVTFDRDFKRFDLPDLLILQP